MSIINRLARGGGMTAGLAAALWKSTVAIKAPSITSAPKPPFERLVQAHCERIVAADSSRDLVVQLALRVEGTCPSTHENAALRVVEELFSNSVEHGFRDRPRGHVFVHIVSELARGVQISVSDDGWGFAAGPIIDRNGFHLLRQLGSLYLGAPSSPFVSTAAVTVIVPPLRSQRTATR